MLQEERLDQYEALEEVRFRTVDATREQAFLAGGDVRIGDFILLVDSDTRVPEHCILPTVTELLLSPEVAFTQHFTTPLQVRGACCHPCIMPMHPVYVPNLALTSSPALACNHNPILDRETRSEWTNGMLILMHPAATCRLLRL